MLQQEILCHDDTKKYFPAYVKKKCYGMEAIEYFTYLAGLVHYSLLFYMVLVPTTLLLITWLCTSNAREI